jgi:hypothetical protein
MQTRRPLARGSEPDGIGAVMIAAAHRVRGESAVEVTAVVRPPSRGCWRAQSV